MFLLDFEQRTCHILGERDNHYTIGTVVNHVSPGSDVTVSLWRLDPYKQYGRL